MTPGNPRDLRPPAPLHGRGLYEEGVFSLSFLSLKIALYLIIICVWSSQCLNRSLFMIYRCYWFSLMVCLVICLTVSWSQSCICESRLHCSYCSNKQLSNFPNLITMRAYFVLMLHVQHKRLGGSTYSRTQTEGLFTGKEHRRSPQWQLNVCGNSLTVQWLGLHTSTAGARVPSLVGELRSLKVHGPAKKK